MLPADSNLGPHDLRVRSLIYWATTTPRRLLTTHNIVVELKLHFFFFFFCCFFVFLQEGIQNAKLVQRKQPCGYDRNHSRYWIFSYPVPGLFVEKGWASKDLDYTVRREDETDDDDDDDMIEEVTEEEGEKKTIWKEKT